MSDPILIDTERFTREAQQQEGIVRLHQLDARVAEHELLVHGQDTVHYRIRGGTDRWQRPYLEVHINGDADLVCQRCLQPVRTRLDDYARIVLFADEAQLDEAMAADETLEGMLLEAETNVTALVEDQILMAIPFAPRHERCGQPTDSGVNQNRNNPFAQLAGLKKGR